jgi:rRNA maturation protein Nop10
MGSNRRYKPSPYAICDNCERMVWSSHDRGLVCWFCDAGVFINAMHWDIVECPECQGEGRGACDNCGKNGYLAIPKEFDLEIDRLREDWRFALQRAERHGGQVPRIIVEMGKMADEAVMWSSS